MRDSLRNIYLYFQRSFIEEFHFYLLYTVLYCLPYIIGNICSEECSLKFVVWEFLHDFVICNVSFLLICILPNRGRVIACRVLATLVLVNFFVESSCLIGIHSIFTDDMVSIIMATNIGESKEFISTYFSFKVAIAWSIAALFYIIVLKKKVFPNKIARYVANIILTILCLCVLYFEYKGTESYNPKLYRKVSFFKNFEAPPDLRHYQERYKFRCALDDTPEYVIMIIGESFSKYHSSLYAYEKETNPKLTELKKDSLLFVYKNVEAPALNTIEALKRLMSTFSDELIDTLAWYECPAIPTVMSSCGYNTVWISNQSPTGIYDNVATRYSELCDTAIFVGSTVKGIHKNDLDEELLINLRNYTFEDGNKYFVVLHLMGSHCRFSDRYPADMEVFKKEDYLDYSPTQRKVRAAYDNSVIYNDSIVFEIFKYFNAKESLGLYFSDHGLDVYKSSPDYYGHAVLSDTTSMIVGKQIPFMMYTSEQMKEKYPNTIYQLDSVFASGFNTGEIMETIMSVFEIQTQ